MNSARPGGPVVRVGLIPFSQAGVAQPRTGMRAQAARWALEDAGLADQAVQQALRGDEQGDSAAHLVGQHRLGLGGACLVTLLQAA